MSKTVKETKELLKAVELLAVQSKKVVKDGLEVSDLSHLLTLVKEHQVLVDGFKDLKEVDDEFKDLSQEEVVELVMSLLHLVKAVKEA